MDGIKTATQLKGSWCYWLLQFAVWLCSISDVLALETTTPSDVSSVSLLASPPKSGIFKPIDISPAVIPHYSFPGGSLPPMYPTYPTTYEPVLTGRCPVNFSAISSIMEITASDCIQLLAGVVANIICCPQFSSLLHIFQGFYSTTSDHLVLQNAVADDCFKDIVSILASRGANSSVPIICSAKSTNLTGGSCPVKDVVTFEKTVNTSKLLDSCSTIDPLKECCRSICQPAIMEAALKLSGVQSFMNDNKDAVGLSNNVDIINDCKGVVVSWISRKLPHENANKAFRILSACKVNKACPLDMKQPTEVIAACRNVAAPSPSCCSSVNTYIAGIQRQMLITNKQAIICATMFGAMLQKAGVMTNVYELCDVDLKDFSLQGENLNCFHYAISYNDFAAVANKFFFYLFLFFGGAANGQEGCLLGSLPADMIYYNLSGFSFTCDLRDNIAAPWPSSSSMTSLSLCAPEMSLPALPTSKNLGNPGCRGVGADVFVSILSIFVFGAILF
ncbi:hypothetical protein SASPL_147903 [Salvia splendens]|uniref:SPARK domain-containing protein n=1 Tax=Salvia splendens TaxID=180675 RepID=A0A8X8Z6Y7_SALSN|nr:hypothetical protein SASPL_147903 [Salvia splendens]